MNRVMLAGRLVADPESMVTKAGTTVCRISVACNDMVSRKNEVYFFPCVAWKARAKFISVYLKKGSPVIIDGRLQRRSYVNADGNTIYNTEVVIDNIRSFGSSNNSGNSKETFSSQSTMEDQFVPNEQNAVVFEEQKASQKNQTEPNFQEDTKDENKDVEDFDLDWLDDIDN